MSDAAAAGEGDDYAALRTMIAQRNLEALRMQSERLGAAAPDTLARQIAEWEQADPGAPA
ncbi:hypothetical protein PA7_33230 [Pseudonocardia asaccharolytica DSM 44247 = NBRC 16224]|uniref:Uncharacterized protein n=1 Tax=Pseudonocardia asaccharolytica DSM 44247 = NBRC 16224 TaxID=1123024 RepID=A0A511D3X0_9PSEU|nr:hypothetical protein PA7_33230 [Pseudonocardia asaccharolytica DSM 44247 = NBRC 16224]